MTDPRMTPTNDAPVTDEDRKRAAYFLPARDQGAVLAGQMDHLFAVQSFRDHRLAALASAPAGDGVEEALAHAQQCLRTIGDTIQVRVRRDALKTLMAAALARPRAAVGEQSREVIEKALRNAQAVDWQGHEHRTVEQFLSDTRFADEADGIIRRLTDAVVAALQSPPAKVEK